MNIIAELVGSKRIGSAPELALFYKSHNRAIVMQQLIFWWGKSKHEDNWFYLTAKELAEQLAMTERQVKYVLNWLEDKSHIICHVSKPRGTQKKHTWININWDVFIPQFNMFNQPKLEPQDEIQLPTNLPKLGGKPHIAGKDKIVLSEDNENKGLEGDNLAQSPDIAGKDKIVLSYSIHKDLHKDLSLEKNQPSKIVDPYNYQISDLEYDHEFEAVGLMSGYTGDIENEFFKFIGNCKAKNLMYTAKTRWVGEWQKWIGKAKGYSKQAYNNNNTSTEPRKFSKATEQTIANFKDVELV